MTLPSWLWFVLFGQGLLDYLLIHEITRLRRIVRSGRECLLGSKAGEKYPSCAKYPDCICGGPPDQPGCTHE